MEHLGPGTGRKLHIFWGIGRSRNSEDDLIHVLDFRKRTIRNQVQINQFPPKKQLVGGFIFFLMFILTWGNHPI